MDSLRRHGPEFAKQASSEEIAQQLFQETLQLGLLEFPGSAVLQLYALTTTTTTPTVPALQAAQAAIGRGSHRNEDDLVVQIYHKMADLLPPEQVFVQRALTPMQRANESPFDLINLR